MIPCVGLASGIGAGNTGCGKGPLAFKQQLSLDNIVWNECLSFDYNEEEKFDFISAQNAQFAQLCYETAREHPFFFSFGGDHSSALGTWSGVAEAKRSEGDIGLIWIDAHMDSHTAATSPSGNIHGMPLAALLGHGDPRLKGILSSSPKVKPENVVLIGVRSFEIDEAMLLKKLNVRVYFMDEVRKRGLVPILEEVTASFAKRTCGYGVSFDLDSIDPEIVKAVGTPVPDGISPQDAVAAMDFFARHRPLALEVVEYNPDLDSDLATLEFTSTLLKTLTDNIVVHHDIPSFESI